MKKAKGWLIGLAIFFVLGIIGGMMEDETPTPPTADIVATETTKTDDTTTPTDIETEKNSLCSVWSFLLQQCRTV